MRWVRLAQRSSGCLRGSVEMSRSSRRVSDTTVSFVFEICCLISFWRVPVQGMRWEMSVQRETWELKKQQEKASWNPDSICVTVITNACFPNKSPSVDEASGVSGSPAERLSSGRWGFPYIPCGGFRGSRWRGRAGVSYSFCSSACLQPANPSQPRSLQSRCGASVWTYQPHRETQREARPFPPPGSVRAASRPRQARAHLTGIPGTSSLGEECPPACRERIQGEALG